MANDWIKMRTDLYRDPKVCLMAEKLLSVTSNADSNVTRNVTRNTMRNACVGALLSVWGVVRHRGVRNGDDLVCYGSGLWVLDDISDMPGFGQAMASVSWVVEDAQGLVFPRFFDEYNVEPDGKNKSKNAERQARYREKKRLGLVDKSNVTRNVTRNVTVTPREEKRREENINQSINPACPDGLKKDWQRWCDFRFAQDGKPIPEIRQNEILMDLMRRGEQKAIEDIAFSIRLGAKNICDSSNDLHKPRVATAASPRRYGKETAEEARLRKEAENPVDQEALKRLKQIEEEVKRGLERR